jgi:membrane-associated phospholipid phosphatase
MEPVMESAPLRRTSALAARPTACLAVLSLAFALLYVVSNRLASGRSDVGAVVFAWEHAIPFVEWTIVPYVSICGFFALSFFVGRDPQELERHAWRLLLALLISVLCYAIFPLRMTFERPATTGVCGLLFSALAWVDLPYNRAPSLHISVLVLLWVRFAAYLAGWLRRALHVWFALIGVSVLTTYQHHVIDVPGGLLVGILCIVLTKARERFSGIPARASRSRPAHPAP